MSSISSNPTNVSCHHLREVSKARSSWTPVCSRKNTTKSGAFFNPKAGIYSWIGFFSSFYSNLKYFPKKIRHIQKRIQKCCCGIIVDIINIIYIYICINCWSLSFHFWYLLMVKLPLLLVNGFPEIWFLLADSPFSLVHIPMLSW